MGFENIGKPQGYCNGAKLYSTKQVAEAANLPLGLVVQRIKCGKYPAAKFGQNYAITESVAKAICDSPDVANLRYLEIKPTAEFKNFKAYSPEALAKGYNIEIDQIYECIQSGEIKSIKIGNDEVIITSEARKLLGKFREEGKLKW